MSVQVVEKVGDVKIYGNGQPGGKGAGLVRINECNIPTTHKLRTRVLSTIFFDRFIERIQQFGAEEITLIKSILEKVGDMPISVRSSATNEACLSPEGIGSVHAGENTSFMLPNNHPDFSVRLEQLKLAIYNIYLDFIKKQPADSSEKMAIVINPICGVTDQTYAGPIYYPMISGIANSFFPYALKSQNPDEGFARIAFGHGYATVFDDFPVISMATIKNPLPVQLLGEGQAFFYALDMTKNAGLRGEELETMRKLNIRFASYFNHKILGVAKNRITLEPLIKYDHYAFKSNLLKIMETISSRISSHYQIEFVFNIEKNQQPDTPGVFHVVQLTELPKLDFEKIRIPENVHHTYLSIKSLQGHGIKQGIKSVIVISPFIYSREMHDSVLKQITSLNREMKQRNENYIIIVPGRLGSKNRNWGIQLEYADLDNAVAIFEYGVDIEGRAEPIKEKDDMTGGIYGSHFLYMIQGGHDEEQKRLKTRMYGTQGTHFLTNLMGNNIIYGYIAPAQDKIDPWFFAPPNGEQPAYVLSFPKPVSIYADSANQQCVVIAENE
ncbi:hypothetical protein GF337_10040 [candidate division KSB1 bacterium]|nr:hypothetical protein [candidate division KSB1 bacterium]